MKWPTKLIEAYRKTIKSGIVANSSSKIYENIYKKTIKSGIVAISSYIIDENQYKTIKKVVLWPFLAKNVQNCTFQIIL